MTDVTTDDTTIDEGALWDETDDDSKLIAPTEVDDELEETEETEEPEEVSEEKVSDGEETEGDAEEDESEAEPEIDYKALWDKSQNEVKAMNGRLKASELRLHQENEELARKVPAAPLAPTEEDNFLAKFRETYSDDVVKAIDLITSRKASQMIDASLSSRLSPLENQTAEMVSQAHFGAIEIAHPDLDEIDASPLFESWLQTRPVHIRAAYSHIRERGTPAEVISMLDEYKENIGSGKQKTIKPVSAPKAKVIAATAVGRRRGTVGSSKQVDDSDLAALWAETDD